MSEKKRARLSTKNTKSRSVKNTTGRKRLKVARGANKERNDLCEWCKSPYQGHKRCNRCERVVHRLEEIPRQLWPRYKLASVEWNGICVDCYLDTHPEILAVDVHKQVYDIK